MFRDKCLCCGSHDLEKILDLGMHPMADTFIATDKTSCADNLYPLICDLCLSCNQIQLRSETDPVERYVDVDYSYTSSNSHTSRAHWVEYAHVVSERCDTPHGSLVLEIGSNDGFLLDQFRKLGFSVCGVEPAPAMLKLASSRDVKTINDFFSLDLATRLIEEFDHKPELIVANNVFNHANEPLDFARGVKALLSQQGIFVFELPYWLVAVEQSKIDQVYHEHISYFTVSYAVNLFASVDMQVIRAEEINYHGGSIRIFVSHGPDALVDQSVQKAIRRETSAGLFELNTYRTLEAKARDSRNRFLAKLYRLKASGESIVCIGAAAKGNTFLNFYNLDSSIIDYVTDTSPSKIGKYTPRTRILIKDDQVISEYSKVNIIILSWNLAEVLKKKLSQINPNITLLNPYE